MSSTFIIRDALDSDLAACLALDHRYSSDYVWQMNIQQATGEWLVSFKTERLPRLLEAEYLTSDHRLRLTLPSDQCLLVAVRREAASVLPDVLNEPEDNGNLGDQIEDAPPPPLSDNTVLGYLSMRHEPARQVGWIQDFVVDREYRRMGIGTRLLKVARRWAYEHAITRLMVETQTRNFPSISFCLSSGFAFCGYNDRYFENQDIAIFFGQTLR